jgi:DNA-binding transcriptional ArsR family regulator
MLLLPPALLVSWSGPITSTSWCLYKLLAMTCTSQSLFVARLGIVSEAVFHALADPRRRAILRLVRDQPRSVNDIAEKFDITQQAISLHLKVLKDAGLVAVHPQGQQRLYAMRPEGLAALRDFLAEFWPERLQRLKHAVESRDQVAETADAD